MSTRRTSRAAAILPFLVGAALGAGCREPAEVSVPARPNVLLVTLDTTRADRLGLYGYERPTSPRLDALGATSDVFERAYSTSSWTLPAHASLFTGKLPASHGVRHDPEGPLVLADAIDAPDVVRARGIAPGLRTLAEVFEAEGYATGAVVAGPWLLRAFGFGKGFGSYDDEGIVDAAGRPAADVTASARAWLEQDRDAPWFLFLNYFDPHMPYLPPESHVRAFLPKGVPVHPRSADQAPALYDAEILYMDSEFGRLLDFLEDRNWLDQTLIVVTSDHGEMLGERGEWGHERFLWEPLVRVPLLVKAPGQRVGARREETYSIAWLPGRILDEVGIDAARAGFAPGSDQILAEVNPMTPAHGTGEWRARWEGTLKYLSNDLGQEFLYDLSVDPQERRNLVPRTPERVGEARLALEAAFDALPPPPEAGGEVHVDAETVEALRRMGYLEGPAGAEAGLPPDEGR